VPVREAVAVEGIGRPVAHGRIQQPPAEARGCRLSPSGVAAV